jgi:hypothetical protein
VVSERGPLGQLFVPIDTQPSRGAFKAALPWFAIRMRLPFTWVADFYTLFAAGQRVRIRDQHDWLCNNRFTFR